MEIEAWVEKRGVSGDETEKAEPVEQEEQQDNDEYERGALQPGTWNTIKALGPTGRPIAKNFSCLKSQISGEEPCGVTGLPLPVRLYTCSTHFPLLPIFVYSPRALWSRQPLFLAKINNLILTTNLKFKSWEDANWKLLEQASYRCHRNDREK